MMPVYRSGRAWGLLVLVAAILLTSCSPTPADSNPAAPPAAPADDNGSARGAGPTSRMLTVATTSDAVSFHPYKTTDTASSAYIGLVYAGGLVRRNPWDTSQFEPDMAESWEISLDKLTYTFHLRGDLRWSDGHPLTAHDFKWTFDQANNPDNRYPRISAFEPIASYEAVDDRTLVITMKDALAVGLDNADYIRPLPKHIWERLDWNETERNPEIMRPTVTSGPFKLQEWQRDSHATFVANPLYYRGRPKLDGVVYQIVGTTQIAWQKLRSGEVDRAALEPEYYEQAKQSSNLTTYDWWPANPSWNYIGFNLRRPLVQDVNVRRALAHAVDRRAIAERIQYGLAEPTHSPLQRTCWCYNADAPKYEFEPARARDLLAQAGWRPGSDGILAKDGQPLKLRLIYGPNNNKVRQRIAEVVQAEYRKLGVEVEVQSFEWAAFLKEVKTPPFDWDLVVLGWTSTIDPHWMYQIWSEKSIPDLNYPGYINKRVEELFGLGVRAFDLEDRKRIYGEIQSEITRDAPYIFVTVNKAYVAVNKRIGGIEPAPAGIDHNLHEWYIR